MSKEVKTFDVHSALNDYVNEITAIEKADLETAKTKLSEGLAKIDAELEVALNKSNLTKDEISAEKATHKAKKDALKVELGEELKVAENAFKLAKKRAKILKSAKKKEYAAWEKAGFDPETTESEVEKLNHDSFKPELEEENVLLRVSHLKQYFQSGSGANKLRTKAVHDISFDIHKGEVFGLVGESGCGKTTTGRSIIRLYDITSGSVYYKGHRITGGTRWNEKEIKWKRIRGKQKILQLKAQMREELSESETTDADVTSARAAQIRQHFEQEINEIKYSIDETVRIQKAKIKLIELDNKNVDTKLLNQIQMIFQDPSDSLDPRMTVEDTIQEGLQIQGFRNKAENSRKVAEMLNRVGLIPEYASRYPHEFSGGQRQRIGIARAIIMNPELMICDEPVSALDVSIRAQIINLLSDLRDEMGLTLLFIAHDLSLVKYFCDRIAVMYFGEIVELATSEELFAHPLHPYTKSLISAIPKPDPMSEKVRERIHYNPVEAHNYTEEGKPELTEIRPGHWVLANEKELAAYQLEIEELDKVAKVKAEAKASQTDE